MFMKLLARDLSIVALTALIWNLGAAASAHPGMRGDVAGVLVGVTIGLCAYLVHEWGHLVGAVLSGSTVRPAKVLTSGFLFSFDSRANTRRQFLAMSFSGWLATAAALWMVYALLPSGLFASRVAAGVVTANVLLVIVVEVPLVAWSLWTGRVPPVETQATAAPFAATAD